MKNVKNWKNGENGKIEMRPFGTLYEPPGSRKKCGYILTQSPPKKVHSGACKSAQSAFRSALNRTPKTHSENQAESIATEQIFVCTPGVPVCTPRGLERSVNRTPKISRCAPGGSWQLLSRGSATEVASINSLFLMIHLVLGDRFHCTFLSLG